MANSITIGNNATGHKGELPWKGFEIAFNNVLLIVPILKRKEKILTFLKVVRRSEGAKILALT